jgi:hypothetical protein
MSSPFPQTPDAGKEIPSIIDIYRSLDGHVAEDERLRIYKIKIASPGGFSFTGVGEIIGEIRQLIKDLWFRNKHEKRQGELALLAQYLTIRRDHPDVNMPPTMLQLPDPNLTLTLQQNVENIKQLERANKLESVPENINHVPE